jgi:hypothetical protein
MEEKVLIKGEFDQKTRAMFLGIIGALALFAFIVFIVFAAKSGGYNSRWDYYRYEYDFYATNIINTVIFSTKSLFGQVVYGVGVRIVHCFHARLIILTQRLMRAKTLNFKKLLQPFGVYRTFYHLPALLGMPITITLAIMTKIRLNVVLGTLVVKITTRLCLQNSQNTQTVKSFR